MSGLEAYQNYRDSGIEWLGNVPRDWPLVRGKFRFKSKKTINKNLECLDRLALTMNGVIDRSITENDGLQPSDFNSYQIFEKNDLVFKLIDLENFKTSRVGLVPRRGIMSPAYIRLVADCEINSRFFYHQYFDLYLRGIYNEVGGQGVRSAINASDLLDLPVLSPSLSEQTQIAKFLDYETAKIDALIEKQQQLIALLKEKRQAVISHAVTKGLNPDAPMRDSGVEWLGEVPAHWSVCRIKQVAKLESGHTPSRGVDEYWQDCQIPWVSLNDTSQLKVVDYISETAVRINEKGMANSSAHELPAGCVVFTRDATIGLAAITARVMAVSQHIIAWVCDPRKVSSEYLLLVFYAMEAEVERFTFGATLRTIGMPDVKRLTGVFPPLHEQAHIVEHVFSAREVLTASIKKSEQMLEVLAERRTALISAAVTGKIDVRSWKAPAPKPEAEVA